MCLRRRGKIPPLSALKFGAEAIHVLINEGSLIATMRFWLLRPLWATGYCTADNSHHSPHETRCVQSMALGSSTIACFSSGAPTENQ